ncbi:hypothetical protein ACO0K0_15805 [Undibacterium sp. SXout11W]
MKNVTPNVQASDAVLKPKLLDQLKRCIRDKYYSLRNEETYVYWARWVIRLFSQLLVTPKGGNVLRSANHLEIKTPPTLALHVNRA